MRSAATRQRTRAAKVSGLVSTAKRLRATRAACRKFLALWALDQGRKNCASGPRLPRSGQQENQIADPMNHDWSLLYLGSILDD
jgi:hypothetical protein